MNAVGATVTAATLVIIVVSKFTEGAWATLLVIPGTVVLMRSIRKHRLRVSQELTAAEQLPVDRLCPPLVVVPMDAWDKAAQRALRFGMSISQNVLALHIDADNQGREIERHWPDWVNAPARQHGLRPPELVVVPSPYRVVVQAVVDYVLELQRKNPDGIAVIVPTVVERRWYRRFLHNQRGELLTALLLLNGQPRISIVNVPWRLHS